MDSTPTDPRGTFGPAAERYATSQVHSSPTALKRLVEIVEPTGGVLLDVATGSGHTAMAFAPHIDRIVATDLTHDMLLVCRREAQSLNLTNLDVAIARAESLPFQSDSFDGVTCRLGAHHFVSVTAFLAEVHRVLRPGGWFLLADTTGPEDEDAAKQLDDLERMRDPSHVHDFRPNEWRAMLHDTGFQVQFEEESSKTLEAQDWMDRTAVPIRDQLSILIAIQEPSATLRHYFNPRQKESLFYFDLHEHVFLCRK